MTPITLIKPAPISSSLTDNHASLALQPLLLTEQRHCANPEVMAAITEALSDKSRSDQDIARILKTAFQCHYVPELNQIIEGIINRHGPDSVTINQHVRQLLADAGIDLVLHDDGTVRMARTTARYAYPERHELISSCSRQFLCGDVASVLCAFDDEIEISDKNREEIITILRSGDASAKSLVIAAASHQQQIPWINELVHQFRSEKLTLDLSWVDLRNLDLTGIRLTDVDLQSAKLTNTRLDCAILNGANLRFANLNRASMSCAVLRSADLGHARLIGARLQSATLIGARLNGAYFLCADMQEAELDLNNSWNHSLFTFANMQNCSFSGMHLGSHLVIRNTHSDATIYSSMTSCELSDHTDPDEERLVIDDDEKAILLAHGITITDMGDGTVALSRAVISIANNQRHNQIDSVLQSMQLPQVITRLVADYDEDIEINKQNKRVIGDILLYGDPSAKSLIIASASRQRQIGIMNEIFSAMRQARIPLNLSHVDLSNLNLSDIQLTGANLSYARLQSSCLAQANLQRALLIHANMNGTNLERADLDDADLSHARLIAAHLWATKLRGTKLNGTLLLCANLQTPYLTYAMKNSCYRFASVDMHMYPQTFTLDGINAPLNVSIVPDYPDQTMFKDDPALSKSNTIVITESERRLLMERRLQFDRISNGRFEMSRPILLHKSRERDHSIGKALEPILPTVLTKIISDYDDEFDICPANETLLVEILKSNDKLAKAQIIVAASHQSKIAELNTLFARVCAMKVTLDFSGIDLSNLKLSGINLNDANLAGTNLRDCDLSQATLRNASLTGANLNGATLINADFNLADLTKAWLLGANLFRARLFGARLPGAILKFANLTKADLQGWVNLQGAYLDHANLDSANLSDVDLTNASLTKATMRLTRLNRANLSGASLVHATLQFASLMSTNLTRADFSHATLDDVTLMMNPILTDTIWTDASFRDIYSDPPTKKQMPFRMWMHCK